jgi:altronate hydrolase
MLQAADIVIRLNPADDVVIARVEIPAGTLLLREDVRTSAKVAPGHKIAVRDVKAGAPVRRYNQIIGDLPGHRPPGRPRRDAQLRRHHH